MVSNTSGRSSFVDDLSGVYWTYALSFALFVALAAILEQVGVPNPVLGYLFVFFTLGAYATIGVLARTMQVAEFYVGARQIPGLYNGMATAAGWLSGAMFLGLPGVMFELDDNRSTRDLLIAGGWTPLTAICLMLFSLCHNPCSTTLYTIYKETRSKRWTTWAALLPTVIGIVLCAGVAAIWRMLV